MDRINVLLVMEVRLIGNLFASVLGEEPDLDVVGWVARADQALEFCRRGAWMLSSSVSSCRTRERLS